MMKNQDRSRGVKTSFIKLIEDHRIEIPMIQRDYAQGRPNKKPIRDSFLKELFNRLNNDENIDLDFVYGSVEGNTTNGDFIPLDGQQRLTTLFLLHWYLAHLDGEYEHLKERLVKNENEVNFSYKTRPSSSDFCKNLIFHNFDREVFSAENKISDFVKDCSWYFYTWEKDTTVFGMLEILDAIHQKFSTTSGFYNKLVRDDLPIITFYFLNLKEFKLTDDLYIKMNARGMPLTNFENFKARFEKFIETHHFDLKQEFSKKMDAEWCDLFWDYAEKKDGQSGYDLLDKPLMNFIDFVTEMLYQKNRKDGEEIDVYFFDKVDIVYKDRNNLEFLLNSLNLFSSDLKQDYKNSNDLFFNNLFSKNYEEDKVNLFQTDLNLFTKCISGKSFEHFDKLLFFSFLYYFHKANSKELIQAENLRDYLRVCRNYIIRNRQQKKDEYIPNIRVDNYKDILKNIMLFFDEKDVYGNLILIKDKIKFQVINVEYEIEKAKLLKKNNLLKSHIQKLEDHQYLKGSIHNLLPSIKSEGEAKFISESFFSIWDNEKDSLIIRSLVAVGDSFVKVANSRWGQVRFFGKGQKWNRVLTVSGNKIQEILSIYFKTLKSNQGSINERLNLMIVDSLKDCSYFEWQYYFLKYPSITSMSHNSYIFCEGLDIEYVNGASLRYEHINTFSLEVIKQLKPKGDFVNEEKSWKKNDEESNIYCRNGIKLTFGSNEDDSWWDIKVPYRFDISKLKFLGKVENENKSSFTLYSRSELDYVEIAVDFILKTAKL